MGTEILKSFEILQEELERAKDTLKGVDENIKRLIGRDPNEGPTRQSFPDESTRTVPDQDSADEEEFSSRPAVPSRVIATPRETKSRQEVLAAQSADSQSKARNRRMFGALLGTLQKFQQEETRLREKFFQYIYLQSPHREEKRARVEKKLEDAARREREELRRERQELFLDRKRKQAEIRKIELKILRIKELTTGSSNVGKEMSCWYPAQKLAARA
ncbi:hypothetical protein J437_LFUL014035 [Ladona fulva]|uniref:Pinin n=1 Tax=Ladona fulva TaxID=123851 RepID=A0A8K0KKT4_LADFU|nr:hypothetical protein J437_LFUL014035 [Ladona fulva]